MSVFDLCQRVISSPQTWICLVAVMSLVQVSPLKINPWAWIGNALNKDIREQIAELDKRINKVEEGVKLANDKCDQYSAQREEDKCVSTRRRILNFNDELIWEKPHSIESFKQILKDITYYENYCDEHKGFCNAQATAAIKNIRRTYDENCKEHSFLDQLEKEMIDYDTQTVT